jgi:hypothetical protein
VTRLKRFLAPLEKFLIIETVWLMLKYAKNRRQEKNLKSLHWLIQKSIQMFTNRLKIVRKENSFAGEGKILQETMIKLFCNQPNDKDKNNDVYSSILSSVFSSVPLDESG